MSHRPSLPSPRASLFLALALAGGCVGEDDDPGALEFRESAGGGNTCSTCNLNSPRLNDFGIPHVHASFPNESGVTWLGVEDPYGQPVTDWWLTDGVLWIRHRGRNFGGPQLIGSKLRFDTPDGVIKVEIAGFSAASGLAPGLPDIPTYALKYGPADASPGELHSVCPSYALTPDEAVVTLIRGETYDRQTNEVHESPGWMSLACADEAVYKMMRLGYGPHSDFAGTGSPATLEQRQATIRMITADYCGTGHSFTQPNTPLVWTNVGGSVVGDGGGTPLTLEAYWNRSGAICLDTTRLPLEGLDKVTNYCDIPPCSLVNTEQIEYEWVTEVPL
jgi:hypothetical protein